MSVHRYRALVFLGALACVVGLAGCDREPAAWNSAKGRNTAEAYESYLKEHAAGPHAVEAKQRLAERQEDRAWDKAKSMDTTEAVDKYLAAYPQGRFVTDAKKQRDGLVETQAWKQAKAANTVESMESFLQQHPQTQRKNDAEQLLTPLREARDWEKASTSPTIELLEAYLGRYPASSRTAEAKRLLDPLYEARDWELARKSRSVTAVKDFLTKHPTTAFAQKANSLIRSLHWQQVLAQKGPSSNEVSFRCTRGMLYDPDESGNPRRNGATVQVKGRIGLVDESGGTLQINIAGIIWSKDERLFSSYLYSYDTEVGESDMSRFKGLTADPPFDATKPVSVFRLDGKGGVIFEQ